jgi:ankyrin repeat protein
MLHFAAFYGHIKAMRYCLTKIDESPDEADLEKALLSRSKEKDTPLLVAIEAGELPAFWLLINERNESLATQQLMARNNALNNPLMAAFLHGRIEMALYLLTKFAEHYTDELDFVDSEGNTLLHLAAKNRDQSSVYLTKILHKFREGQVKSMLLKPNNDGFPPLYLAVVEGNYYFAEHILDRYAEVVIRTVHARSKDGERMREWLHRNAGYD